MRATRCPFFNCSNVKKNGIQSRRQRYFCAVCNRSWASKPRPGKKLAKLWDQYAFDGRSVRSLAREYKVSSGYVRKQLKAYTPPQITQKPRTVAVIMDVTYFKDWGILVVIDPYAKVAQGENLVIYYAAVEGTEKTHDYEVATDTIKVVSTSTV